MTATTGGVPIAARSESAPDTVGAQPQRGAERFARLADRAGALRGRGRGEGSADRWLLVVGGVAMPLGVVLVLLGWYGSAQTVLPFEQIPYLISGGLLGLALVVGGGFLYFAYWLTLMVREARGERERAAAHQDRLERLLVELNGRLGAPAGAPVERVVTTPSGTLLHRPTCVATVGLDVVEVPTAPAGAALCGLCQPVPPPVTSPLADVAPQRRPRAPRTARSS